MNTKKLIIGRYEEQAKANSLTLDAASDAILVHYQPKDQDGNLTDYEWIATAKTENELRLIISAFNRGNSIGYREGYTAYEKQAVEYAGTKQSRSLIDDLATLSLLCEETGLRVEYSIHPDGCVEWRFYKRINSPIPVGIFYDTKYALAWVSGYKAHINIHCG